MLLPCLLQDAGLWVDALRVCREYQPAKLASLQAEYEREVGSRGARDVSSILSQVYTGYSYTKHL